MTTTLLPIRDLTPAPKKEAPKEEGTDLLSAPHPTAPEPSSLHENLLHYRRAKSVEEKEDYIRLITGQSDRESLQAIGQLFTQERDPRARLALISGLGDIPKEVAPDARLQILRAALQKQPRDVRSAALDLLAESDDKRAQELIRQAARNDPDREIRDAAKALIESADAE